MRRNVKMPALSADKSQCQGMKDENSIPELAQQVTVYN